MRYSLDQIIIHKLKAKLYVLSCCCWFGFEEPFPKKIKEL